MQDKIIKCLSSILFILIIQNLYAGETRIVKVGAFNNYPGIFQDKDGVVKGIYVDALDEIGARENIQFKYIYGSWSEILDRIKSGEIDLLTSVAKTPERELFLDYCTVPLITTWGELYTSQSSEISSILEIKGKTVAVVKNDFNANQFILLTKKFNLNCTFMELPGSEDVFKTVSSGKADAGVVSTTYGTAMFKHFNLRSTGVVFNPFDLYFTTKKGNNRELIQLLDKYLGDWKHKEDSVLIKAKRKWLYESFRTERFIPQWMEKLFIALLIIALISFLFIVLLKLQVKRATVKIIQNESEIRIKNTELEALNEELNAAIEELEQTNMELIEREMELKESELHFRTLSDSGQALIWTSGIDKKCYYFNQPWLDFTGSTIEQQIGDGWVEGVHPEDLDRCVKTYLEAFDRREKFSMAYRLHHAEGGYRWIQDDGTPRYNSLGEFIGYIGHCLDISEQKKAEEDIQKLLREKELLLKEVHHRIKNNMNTIKGLLTLQINAEENIAVKDSLSDAESRVQSMIMLYDRLYFTDNYREMSVKDYLQPLTVEITGGFPNSNIVTIETDIEDFILNVNILTPLGVIVNELLTNMMKYAFTGRESGVINLSASIKENRVKIIISDNGVGIPGTVNFNNSTGFGLNLVKMLVEQIGGVITIERNNGSSFIMEFEV